MSVDAAAATVAAGVGRCSPPQRCVRLSSGATRSRRLNAARVHTPRRRVLEAAATGLAVRARYLWRRRRRYLPIGRHGGGGGAGPKVVAAGGGGARASENGPPPPPRTRFAAGRARRPRRALSQCTRIAPWRPHDCTRRPFVRSFLSAIYLLLILNNTARARARVYVRFKLLARNEKKKLSVLRRYRRGPDVTGYTSLRSVEDRNRDGKIGQRRTYRRVRLSIIGVDRHRPLLSFALP